MRVSRDLIDGQRHRFHAAAFANRIGRSRRTRALVYRGPAAEVGQCEGALAVAAVGGADKRKERIVTRLSTSIDHRTGPSPEVRS